ncbi:GAF domain-containing protein [Streptomyces sp. NPDC004673]
MAPTASEPDRNDGQGELAAYRLRRERELSSLYATARSLTVLGEVDVVLPAIVREAHELIGSDFVYLSLRDADGVLALSAAAGTISPEFSSARMPAGAGLGGWVIETRAPVWVSDYRHADGFHRDPVFDRLVSDEGLVALLGVPLLVGDRVIGVLFAADRTERPFEKDEVALLSAFADHAAIALNNARLYDESRVALQRLQDAYRVIEDQVATMELAAAVHEALTHVVLTGGGPGDIAQSLVEHLRGVVTIRDRDDEVVATRSSGAGTTAADPALERELLERARRTGRCVHGRGDDGTVLSVAAIQAGGSHLGSLSLRRRARTESADVRMLERSAQITGLLVLLRDARVEAEERVRGELLTECCPTRRSSRSTPRCGTARSPGASTSTGSTSWSRPTAPTGPPVTSSASCTPPPRSGPGWRANTWAGRRCCSTRTTPRPRYGRCTTGCAADSARRSSWSPTGSPATTAPTPSRWPSAAWTSCAPSARPTGAPPHGGTRCTDSSSTPGAPTNWTGSSTTPSAPSSTTTAAAPPTW